MGTSAGESDIFLDETRAFLVSSSTRLDAPLNSIFPSPLLFLLALFKITELFHSSLTLSRPLLPANPPLDLPSLTTAATPPLFQAIAALSKIMHGLISSFAARSFPSVVEMLASRTRGGRGESRRDALGYQDEVLVKRFKLGELASSSVSQDNTKKGSLTILSFTDTEVDEWAKKWLGAIACEPKIHRRPSLTPQTDFTSLFLTSASNLGTSAFSTIPDPAALKFVLSSSLHRVRAAPRH